MKRTVVAVLAGLTVLGGCAAGNSAGAARTQVVASSYAFAFVAQNVGGSHVQVDNLTAPGVEPHDVELKPRQVGAVQDADLVIFERHFQAAVDQAVDQADRRPADTIDVAKLVTVLPLGDHADPHTWLDPLNMIAITKAVEARLAAADPANAGGYRAGAAALTARLERLDADYAAGLRTCKTRTIVTSHAAFQYLAHRYRLNQVPVAGLDPSNEPALAQLAHLTALVREQHITTIFTEELVSPAIADTLARSAGVTTAVLDPIEGLSDHTADEDYLSLMASNLRAIKEANSCS